MKTKDRILEIEKEFRKSTGPFAFCKVLNVDTNRWGMLEFGLFCYQKALSQVKQEINREILTDLHGNPLPQCESLWRIKKRLGIK